MAAASVREPERASPPSSERAPLIGVLALQGVFQAHARMLRRLGSARARGARAG